jgi:hypothetical protein
MNMNNVSDNVNRLWSQELDLFEKRGDFSKSGM